MNILRVGTTTVGNTILVTTDSGATVYAVSNGKVVSGVAVGGVAKLKVKAGTWRVWAELDGQQTSEVEVIVTDSYYKEMSFGMPLSSLAEGALVKINESGSGVNFYLAKHDYESGLNGAGRSLVVRKTCYNSSFQWHTSNSNVYLSSYIDSWLNSTYKAVLDSKIQSLIDTTKIYYGAGKKTNTVSSASRSIFVLSMTELNTAPGECPTIGSSVPIYTTLRNDTYSQWTRSPSTADSTKAYYYQAKGAGPGRTYVSEKHGVRPCFTLPATALVNPTPNADGSYTLMV